MLEEPKIIDQMTPEASNHSTDVPCIQNSPTLGDFDGYIIVTSSEAGCNMLEIPLDDDGNLPIATLAHSFPDAIGLKFKNPLTGVYRTLAYTLYLFSVNTKLERGLFTKPHKVVCIYRVDDQKRCIYPPRGGWGKRRFVAIFSISSSDRKRPSNDCVGDLVEEKRSGLDGSLNEDCRVPVDLIVLNLSFKTTEETLKNIFEKYGEVQYVEVKRDFKTNFPKGYGFVKFVSIEAQDRVLLDREVIIDGRMTQASGTSAQVKFPNHFANKPQKTNIGMNMTQDSASTKLYVGRVWNAITEKDIFDALNTEARKISPYANAKRVSIPMPHRGFAFVTINDHSVAKRLCQIRDFIIRGKSVCVCTLTPKNNVHQQQHIRQSHYEQQQHIISYRVAQPAVAPLHPYPAHFNYVEEYPQNPNWMNPRITYRSTSLPPVSYTHEYYCS
ncbi:unnamed protein product [Thelazia callipaeda]|uniref:RRM domain-containing protein n=1 Tax=Thelazia callipaeda TaxID=103827 RepID=A0A0N5DBP3_THECL|nr:unnamed protein product [Thelazia callipaeda]